MAEEKKPFEKKLEEKTEIVGVRHADDARRGAGERETGRRGAEATDGPLHRGAERATGFGDEQSPPHPSHPETLRSARATEKESGQSKAKRVDTADVSPEGEKAPAGWGKKPTVYVMTNVDGEKMNVTVKQWARFGQKLRAKGWTTPEFAEGDPGGNEDIPQDVVWGKDSPDEAASSLGTTLPPKK